MKKTFVIAMLLVLALTASTFAASFADVPANHWAYEAVNKLVAAGIITGYPDGTYGGQRTLTRYEVAVVISRVLEDIEAERDVLAAQVDKAANSLSKGEAKDVTAIVMALLEKNKPEAVELPELPEGLTEQQAEEVVQLVKALTFEFKPELVELGADISVIAADVLDLQDRVAALEAVPAPVVSFSGSYGVSFNYVNIEGDALPKEEGTEYYFVDPYDTNSGDYAENEDGDADTMNEADDPKTPDYRLTDGEDYFEADSGTIENTLELNVQLNKGPLTADVTMKGYKNVFGLGGDDTDFDFDSVEGTIATDDFTATIKDGQTVSFKDYLYDETDVDGVVVNAGDNMYFVGKKVDNEKEYTTVVPGDEDEYYEAERDRLVFGAKQGLDLVLPFNVYVGYEYAEAESVDFEIGDDDWTVDAVVDATSFDFEEVKNKLVAVDTATKVGDFDVTADLALNLNEGAKGHLFRVGATGVVGMLDVTGNFENTKDMVFIQDDADETKEGYDVEVGTTIGIVEGSFKLEDYGNSVRTIKAAVPAGNLSFGEVDVDGSYELETGEDKAKNEIRKINAATSLAGIDLTYAYEYDVDNEIKDETKDRLDDGLVEPVDGDYFTEEDDDVNKHTIAATYAVFENLTAGAKVELEKAVTADDEAIEFGEMERTTTLTADYAEGNVTANFEHILEGKTTIKGRYTEELFEAGFEKVMNDGDDSDLVVDGKVTAPTVTYAGVDVDASAAAKYNTTDNLKNMEVNADLSKVVSDSLTLTGKLGWANKEIDVDFAGTKKVAGIGAEYKITEDLTANAAYNYLDFAGDEEYTVKEATAGVSLAF